MRGILRKILLLGMLSCVFSKAIDHSILISSSHAQDDDEIMSDDEFREKLTEMYNRIIKSVEILREQITQNQAAPFLPNLYLQLGDMLNQKANVIYYIKKENSSGEIKDDEKQFSDVINVTKEAIAVYQRIIAEFPKFKKRSDAYYSLAVAYKSIDSNIEFMKAIKALNAYHKGTKNDVKGQLLLGEDLFSKGMFDEALKVFLPQSRAKYDYERNLAKYKIGLIRLSQSKFKQALGLFEQVVTDKKLEDEQKEAEINLKSRSVKSSLKREALIDSIRAYTEVFKKNARPVSYYSRIAPSENMFHDVIEKLAYRYIQVKRYTDAIKLLRTLSETEASPEKVLNLYKEVLLMIPLNRRITLPVGEIRYVLERYLHMWNFYKLNAPIKRSLYDFFEKQIRDLGTRAHQFGKNKASKMYRYYLKKAAAFYNLYLAIFRKSQYTTKMALNQGDVYFRLDNFLECGDFYLRVFKGEFGRTNQKGDSIKNAIYCLEKEREYSFYELRRIKGLLIEALNLYMKFDPRKRNDPKTNFNLAKAVYDQGFYEQALDRLMKFMRKYPRSKFAVDAANLVLDYFNIKSDFEGLVEWSNRILALNLPNSQLNAKVKQIREQARMRKLQAQVESSSSFDGFAQGKSYLQNAASIGNAALRNLALQKALEASRQEKDVGTFFKSASLMASKERDPVKRYEIESSMAQEHLKMGNFKDAQSAYQKILRGRYSAPQKKEAYDQALTLAVALRDWNALASLSQNRGRWRAVPAQTIKQIGQQVSNALESPIKLGPGLNRVIGALPLTPETSLGLIKASSKLSGAARSKANQAKRSACSQSPSSPACRWVTVQKLDKSYTRFKKKVASAPAAIGAVEKYANEFAGITSAYSQLEGSTDGHIDIVSAIRQADLYSKFGAYLGRVAKKNPSIKAVLLAKANESRKNGAMFQTRCRKIVSSSGLVTPANKFCTKPGSASLSAMTSWSGGGLRSTSVQHVPSSALGGVKKEVFAKYDADSAKNLAIRFYRGGNFHYAAATSVYGLSLGGNSGDFNTLLGCSVGKLGYLSEASYYLGQGSGLGGLKSQCKRGLR